MEKRMKKLMLASFIVVGGSYGMMLSAHTELYNNNNFSTMALCAAVVVLVGLGGLAADFIEE